LSPLVECSKATLLALFTSAVAFSRLLNPTYQKWYMDDGGIVGSPELLLKVWGILRRMVLVLASFSTLPSVSGRGSTQIVFCRVFWSKWR
jgi:hypothetical protein